MKTKITVERTKGGAILVNGKLLRTRQGINGEMSNKEAAYEIMKDTLRNAGVDTDLLDYPYIFDIEVSDKEFKGAMELTQSNSPTYGGFNLYEELRDGHSSFEMAMPCTRWFKKLAGFEPPPTLWLKLILA